MTKLKEFELSIYSKEEYIADLKHELQEKGLEQSIEERLDEIVEEARLINYQTWSFITEKCTEILDLIRSDNNG